MEHSESSLRTVYVPLGRESEALEVVKRLKLICPKKPPVVRIDPCDSYDCEDDDRDFNDYYYREDRGDDDPIDGGEESEESDNDSED